MSDKTFDNLINRLQITPPQHVIKEFFVLFQSIRKLSQNIEPEHPPLALSKHAYENLRANLELQPFPTICVIQQLLICGWHQKFNDNDQALQHMVIVPTMESLLNYEAAADDDAKLLSLMSQCKLKFNFKQYFGRKRQTDLWLYFVLLLRHNAILLQDCLQFNLQITENSVDIQDLIVQTMHTRTHWLHTLIHHSTKPPQLQQLKFLMESNRQILNIQQIQLQLNQMNLIKSNQSDFLTAYITEINRMLKIVHHCLENNPQKLIDSNTIFDYTKTNSALAAISRFANINNAKTDLFDVIDLELYRSYQILIQIIKIIASNYQTSEEYFTNVVTSLNEIKQGLLELKNPGDVMENIFTLLWLRYEHFPDPEKSGFICNDYVLRDVLQMLNQSSPKEPLKSNVIEALNRLYYVTSLDYYNDVNGFGKEYLSMCKCDEFGVTPYVYRFEDSSDSDELSASVESREEIGGKGVFVRRRRSETDKSSEGSETSSAGKAKRKLPKRSFNNDAMRQRKYLLNFMLADPYSLICLCLGQKDYQRVQQIIKAYHLEDSHIAQNVKFTKNLQELRNNLTELFNKKKQPTRSGEISDGAIENLKNLTGSVYDNTQTIKLIFEFASTTRLDENHETKQIIEKYLPVFSSTLSNFLYKNELFQHCADLALTLGTNYQHGCTLFKCANQHPHIFEPGSDYQVFYENVQKCYQEINGGQSGGGGSAGAVPTMLMDCRYDFMNSKNTNKILKFEKKLGNLKTNFGKSPTVSTYNQILNNFNEYDKLVETCRSSINYLQRVQTYLTELMKIIELATTTSKVNIPIKNPYHLLNYHKSELVHHLTNDLNVNPYELEDIFDNLNLNLKLELIRNYFEPIPLTPIPLITEFETLNQITEYLTEFKKPEPFITPPNLKVYAYINQNPIFGYLLSQIYPQIPSPKMEYINNAILQHGFIATLHSTFPLSYLEADLNYLRNNLTERQQRIPLIQKLINLLAYQAGKCLLIRNDLPLVVTCVFNNLKIWSGGFMVKVIKECLTSFGNGDGRMEALWNWLKKIEIYQDIGESMGTAVGWQQIYQECGNSFDVDGDGVLQQNGNVARILDDLIKNQKFNSIFNWFKLHKLNSASYHLITAELILKILTENNFHIIEQILLQLPSEQIKSICSQLIKQTTNFKILHFLAKFVSSLSQYQIGVHLIDSIQPASNSLIWKLIDQPELILEQYLMNTRLEKLQNLIQSIQILLPKIDNGGGISIESVDLLLRSYAAKALEFRVHNGDISVTDSAGSRRGGNGSLLESIDSISIKSESKFVMPTEPPQRSTWMKDYETAICLNCNLTIFSMFNRRHHCRRCGRVVCGSCSMKKLKISIYGDVPVRVCLECYEQTLLQENQPDGGPNNIAEEEKGIDDDALIDYWQLTDNAIDNYTIRNEFSYEYAPSVSLCLSILKLHSPSQEYSKFLLNQCHTMIDLIVPTKTGLLCTEIDYNLVIQMLRSLIIAAKVNSAKMSSDPLLAHCDEFLAHIDILEMLSINNCLHLMPPRSAPSKNSPSVQMGKGKSSKSDEYREFAHRMRKLRDNLMENEKWQLALEVSTKAGLDTQGVFAVWGKTCLKSGCYQQAREKLSYCLDKVDLDASSASSSTTRPTKNPNLITEILDILQNQRLTAATVDDGKVANSPVCILNKLSQLKQIAAGQFVVPLPKQINYGECIYYLKTYGSHSGLIQFYLKRMELKNALCYIQDNQLEADYYIELYMYCLKNGCISELQIVFTEMDTTLETFKDGLKHICRHLEQKSYLHILYQLQVWMGDHIRAAMTSIKFYQQNATTYLDLLLNINHLHTAHTHLKYELESDNQWVQLPGTTPPITNATSTILKMEPREIDKHINTIWRQIEITKYLAGNEKANRKTIELLPEMFASVGASGAPLQAPPTLFGNKIEKIQLATLCICSGENVNDGFGLAFRIIQDYNLNCSKIYCIVAKQLKHIDGIKQLVDCIATSGMMSDESMVCDEVLSIGIKSMASSENNNLQQINSLIQLIQDINIKITALIESKQLKSAYLLAIQHDRMRDVRRILREAIRLNQPYIKSICEKRLAQFKE